MQQDMKDTPDIGVPNEMKRKSETTETDHVLKRRNLQQQERKEEQKNIEEFYEALCNDGLNVANSVVKLFELYKRMPPVAMETEPMRTIQLKVLQLLGLKQKEEEKQSTEKSKTRERIDAFFTNPEVANCLKRIIDAIEAKKKWMIEEEAIQKSDSPLLKELNAAVDKAAEAKRRFAADMASLQLLES